MQGGAIIGAVPDSGCAKPGTISAEEKKNFLYMYIGHINMHMEQLDYFSMYMYVQHRTWQCVWCTRQL